MKIVKLQKKLGSIIKSNEINNQVSNLIDKYNNKTLINSLPNLSTLFLDAKFKTFIAIFITNFFLNWRIKLLNSCLN